MANNQFVVDMGKVKLTDEQAQRINTAIQKAVAGEIAHLNLKEHIALIPVNNKPFGPIIRGIIVQVAAFEKLNELAGGESSTH